MKAHPPPLHTGVARTLAAAQLEHAIFHVRRLAKPDLNAYELMGSLEGATSLEAIEDIVRRCREYSEGKLTFTPGIEAERMAREAHEANGFDFPDDDLMAAFADMSYVSATFG